MESLTPRGLSFGTRVYRSEWAHGTLEHLFAETGVRVMTNVDGFGGYFATLTWLVVQEAHGSSTEWAATFALECRTHRLFGSSCENDVAGGVRTFVRTQWLAASTSVSSTVWIPGRLLSLRICFGSSEVELVNNHAHGYGTHQLGLAARHFRQGASRACANPSEFALVIGGDFNFLAEGDVKHRYESAPPDGVVPVKNQVPAMHKMWRRALEGLVEIQQHLPTYFDSHAMACKRYDRIYV